MSSRQVQSMSMMQIPRRSFGLEIEAIVDKTQKHQAFSDILHSLNLSDDAGSWSVVEDKSLESEGQVTERMKDSMRCELVSPILNFNSATLNTLESICDSLQHRIRANTNDSCGFHIHFDAEDLSLRDIVKVAINYANFEGVIDSFLHRSRRGDSNPYIRSLVNSVTEHLGDLREIVETDSFYNKSSLSVLSMINPRPRKFSKFNMSNSFYFNLYKESEAFNKNKDSEAINTIENRHHQSTLDFEEIIKFVEFNLHFINSSRNKAVILEPQEQFQVLADFIENDDVINFYQRRLYLT